MPTCIWCRREVRESAKEHIVPESLGLIPELILDQGQVCRKCNNKLAFLDRVVADEFEIAKFNAGVPGKRGKRPIIDSRSNLVGRYVDGKPTIVVNMDSAATEALGKRLGPATGNRRTVGATCRKTDDGMLTMTLRHELGNTHAFSRGLHKIAFSFMTFLGAYHDALDDSFNFFRDYVVFGIGRRRVLLLPAQSQEYMVQPHLYWSASEHRATVFVLIIAGAEFVVDLSSDMRFIEDVMAQLRRHQGDQGWTWIPIS